MVLYDSVTMNDGFFTTSVSSLRLCYDKHSLLTHLGRIWASV
jgi:hypothetical protein